MSDATIVLVFLAAGTYVFKAAGPLVLGERVLPARLRTFIDLLPAAMLAALVAVSTLSDGRALVLDARIVGVVVAGLALSRRAPFVLVVVLAAAATAVTRAIAGT